MIFADFADILKSHIADDDWRLIQDLPIYGIVSDSRQVKQGEVFTLLSINPDTAQKAKSYLANITPTAVLSEMSATDMGYADDLPNYPIVHVPNLRLILGTWSRRICKRSSQLAYQKS